MTEPLNEHAILGAKEPWLPDVATVTAPSWLKGATFVNAITEGVSAEYWLRSHQIWLENVLSASGAVLMRGFAPISVEEFERVAKIAGGQPPQAYENRSTPRKRVKGNIYTSTEYPPSETIPLHNENSYSSVWPGRILFLSCECASDGGETPIADSRLVYHSIPSATRALFESKAVTYIRNYGPFGLSWQETFQTNVRHDVQSYCDEHGILWHWSDDGQLQTKQTLPAVRLHPETREPIWFNQAHLFHVSNLGKVADHLVSLFGPDHLPRNATFGDGSEISRGTLREIREAYDSNAATFRWQANDLMILDNMLWAHGRRPFEGNRRVLVAMTNLARS